MWLHWSGVTNPHSMFPLLNVVMSLSPVKSKRHKKNTKEGEKIQKKVWKQRKFRIWKEKKSYKPNNNNASEAAAEVQSEQKAVQDQTPKGNQKARSKVRHDAKHNTQWVNKIRKQKGNGSSKSYACHSRKSPFASQDAADVSRPRTRSHASRWSNADNGDDVDNAGRYCLPVARCLHDGKGVARGRSKTARVGWCMGVFVWERKVRFCWYQGETSEYSER